MRNKGGATRNCFFSNPSSVMATIGTVSFVALLIPSLLELRRLNDQLLLSQLNLDKAQQDCDEALGYLRGLEDNLYLKELEHDKYKNDMICIKTKLGPFNEKANAFLQSLSKTQFNTSTETLAYHWGIGIVPQEISTKYKQENTSYTESIWYDRMPRLITRTYPFMRYTTITELYINKGIGLNKDIVPGRSLPGPYWRLGCGDYSRTFLISFPPPYLIHSQYTRKDSIQAGVYVNETQLYGSAVALHYRMDGKMVINTIAVPQTALIEDAALAVIRSLSKFAATAIEDFISRNTPFYDQLETTLPGDILALSKTLAEIKAMLMNKTRSLNKQQTHATQAISDWHSGLVVWISLLSLPGLITFTASLWVCFTKCSKIAVSVDSFSILADKHARKERPHLQMIGFTDMRKETNDDIEAGDPREKSLSRVSIPF